MEKATAKGIKTVAQAREMQEAVTDRAIDLGRPSYVTASPRGEPRELLKNFHFNYPFAAVIPMPRLALGIRFNNTPVEIDLPDGTILFHVFGGGGIFAIGDGIIPDLAALTQDTPTAGICFNPAPEIAFMCYGNRKLYARGIAGAYASIVPYISSDAAALQKQ